MEIISIIIETVGGWIDLAFELAKDAVLQQWADDVIGRAKAYEAIVKGENMGRPNIPESFNVLVHELRGLALEITLD